jgi:antirestriction protein ArdC
VKRAHALGEGLTARPYVQLFFNSIIKQLEDGTAPWVRPWKNGKNIGIMPNKGTTNRSYNGTNVMLCGPSGS